MTALRSVQAIARFLNGKVVPGDSAWSKVGRACIETQNFACAYPSPICPELRSSLPCPTRWDRHEIQAPVSSRMKLIEMGCDPSQDAVSIPQIRLEKTLYGWETEEATITWLEWKQV